MDQWIYCVHIAIENKFESDQLIQPMFVRDQNECALQQSICLFFGLGVPQSNAKAIDAFHTLDSSSYYVTIDDGALGSFWIQRTFLLDHNECFDGTHQPSANAMRCYSDFLFKKNHFLPFLLLRGAIECIHSGNGNGTHFIRRVVIVLTPIYFLQIIMRGVFAEGNAR